MGVSQLASTQALTPGADLWVVGTPTESPWALKLDWALNFQMLRAGRHKKPAISHELQKVIDQTDLKKELPHLQNSKASRGLLVAADLNLPCRWVLMLEEWNLTELHEAVTGLGNPSLRIFLPRSMNGESFAKTWSSLSGDHDFQLVLD